MREFLLASSGLAQEAGVQQKRPHDPNTLNLGALSPDALSPGEREQLIEDLLDLQHDLGKYMALPFGFLPPEASDEVFLQALRRALLETRTHAGQALGAQDLYRGFCEPWRERLPSLRGFNDLQRAMDRALAWLDEPPRPIPREAIVRDLRAVSPAIRALIEELRESQA